VPVPASVFDDDFFQQSERAVELTEPVSGGRVWRNSSIFAERRNDQGMNRVGFAESLSSQPASVEAPVTRVSSYTGNGSAPEAAHEDELDIPAFLRRGGL